MRSLIFLCGLSLVLSSCIKNNPDPVWIEVNEWTLEANPELGLDEGVLTHNITDAWLYVDNKLIGVFQVPFKVPVISSGNKEIKIFPTIRNNGISATKKIYPFLEEFIVQADLIQNEVFTINPVTRYRSGMQFQIFDFEDASLQIQEGSESTAIMQIVDETDDPTIFDADVNGGIGGHWGQVILNETNNKYVASSSFQGSGSMDMTLPIGEEVYLEIDYYLTESLTTGLIIVTSGGTTENPMIRINEQDPDNIEWKKIYIDLREVVSAYQDAQYFEFSFNAELEGTSNAKINIDNVKAVHF